MRMVTSACRFAELGQLAQAFIIVSVVFELLSLLRLHLGHGQLVKARRRWLPLRPSNLSSSVSKVLPHVEHFDNKTTTLV
jgi:hypothetical protein